MFLNKDNVGAPVVDTLNLSVLSSSTDPRQQIPCQSSSRNEFGLVSSDALVNPSHKISPVINCSELGSQDPKSSKEAESHPLSLFVDDWPKTQPDCVAAAWSALNMQSDKSQVSISNPMASQDFMSSADGKVKLSPPRPSCELDLVHTGLRVGSVPNEPGPKQGNWLPISWETSLGGPLGEVLHNSNNSSTAECRNSSTLNLMTKGWDSSPWVGLSPTGVLQKGNFASLSNSSSGHSPAMEN